MIVNQFILCILFLGVSINSSTTSKIPKDDFAFSSEDFKYDLKNNATSSNDNLEKNIHVMDNNPQLRGSFSNLLNELGSSPPQKVYTNFYNESQNTRICWKSIIYVKSDLTKSENIPWMEHEIVFDYPGEDSEETNDSEGDIVSYRVDDTNGNKEQLNFTVIDRQPNVTISRHVEISCGYGNILKKIVSSSPGNDRQKLVVELMNTQDYYNRHAVKTDFDLDDSYHKNKSPSWSMDENRTLGAINKDNVLSSTLHKSGLINNDSKHMEDISLKTNGLSMVNESTEYTKDSSSPTTINGNTLSNSKNALKLSSSNSSTINGNKNSENVNASGSNILSPSDGNETIVGAPFSGIFVDDLNGNETTSLDLLQGNEQSQSGIDKMSFKTTSMHTIDACSPILAKLLSGNGILPGLCNLKKDEQVLLKGDIVVSKRYYNKEKNIEVEVPVFNIRENSVIEAVNDEIYEESTLQEI